MTGIRHKGHLHTTLQMTKNDINSKYDRVADKLDKLHSVQAAYGIKRRNHKKRMDKPMIGTLKNDKTTIGELFDMSQGEEGCPVVVLYTGRGPPAQVTVCSDYSNVREADSYDIDVWIDQLKLYTDLGVSIPSKYRQQSADRCTQGYSENPWR